eukprot:jgi/Mesvir1/25460/Mv01728-RA.1
MGEKRLDAIQDTLDKKAYASMVKDVAKSGPFPGQDSISGEAQDPIEMTSFRHSLSFGTPSARAQATKTLPWSLHLGLLGVLLMAEVFRPQVASLLLLSGGEVVIQRPGEVVQPLATREEPLLILRGGEGE